MSIDGPDPQRFTRRIHNANLAINIALILTSLLAVYGVWRIQELSRLALDDSGGDLYLGQELRHVMERIVSSDRAFLLTGNVMFKSELARHDARFRELAEATLARSETVEGQRLLRAAMEGKARHSQALASVFQQREGGADLGEVGRLLETQVRPHTVIIRDALDAYVDRKKRMLDEATGQTRATGRFLLWAMGTLSLSDIVLGIVVTLLTVRTLRELSRYAMDLQRAVRARDEFLAIAGHELRTPLAVIKMHVQMMRRRLGRAEAAPPSREELASFAGQVDHGVDGMTVLVNRMLDIANIDRGRLALIREPVDLTALTQEVVERLAHVLAEARCVVEHLPGGAVVGNWDRARLEQVVTNLLMNVARHACEHPATVSVSADRRHARLVVEDRGPGIAPEDRERIFGRFERGAASTDGAGMGLGLAVVREIVGAHGGRIWIDSTEGEGTRFIVELPLG